MKNIFLVFENQGKENISWENASLTELNSKQCTWQWIKDDRNKWGGIFNVTLHDTELCQNGSHLDQQHHENVLLALTCTTCAIRPCISMPFEKKKPDVTFAIPFIVQNKTHGTGKLLIRQTKAIATDTKNTIVILIVSISSFERGAPLGGIIYPKVPLIDPYSKLVLLLLGVTTFIVLL